MASPLPDRIAHHLRGLDEPQRRNLVAALFRARGFEIGREGDVIVASKPGDERRIHVGPAADATPDADLVVDPATGPTPSADPPVIGDDRLAEMLVYGIEPEDTRAICVEHLGAPPAELPAPLSRRLRRRVSVLRPAVPAMLVGVALLTVVAAMAVAVPAVESPEQEEPVQAASPTTPEPATGQSVTVPPPSYPSSPGGFMNASAPTAVDVGDG